jgi:hypothetical protein
VFDASGNVLTNASSLIKTQQDAAFVATDLFIFKMFNDEREVPIGRNGTGYVKLTASSSGRRLTDTKDEALWTNSITNTSLFEFGVPYEQLTPVLGTPNNVENVSAFDYHYKLPVEYLIPRGAVIEAALMQTKAVSGASPDGSPIQDFKVAVDFALGGYKVFGA